MSFVLMLTFPSVLSSVIWMKIDRFHPFCSYISFVGVKTLTALSVTFWPRLSSLMFGRSLLICSNFDYFKFLNLLDFILPKKSVKKKMDILLQFWSHQQILFSTHCFSYVFLHLSCLTFFICFILKFWIFHSAEVIFF